MCALTSAQGHLQHFRDEPLENATSCQSLGLAKMQLVQGESLHTGAVSVHPAGQAQGAAMRAQQSHAAVMLCCRGRGPLRSSSRGRQGMRPPL